MMFSELFSPLNAVRRMIMIIAYVHRLPPSYELLSRWERGYFVKQVATFSVLALMLSISAPMTAFGICDCFTVFGIGDYFKVN